MNSPDDKEHYQLNNVFQYRNIDLCIFLCLQRITSHVKFLSNNGELMRKKTFIISHLTGLLTIRELTITLNHFAADG